MLDGEKSRPRDNPVVQVSSPGRLCLFGEHSDWAAEYGIHPGHCIVVGTDQAMKAVVRPSDAFSVETLVPDETGRPSGRTRQMTCLWKPETLLAAASDENEFFRYCAGVAYEILQRENLPSGLDIRIVDMELPLKRGVSSSAAVCILVAKAFNECYNLNFFPHELMELSYRGERLTGSQCGRMDQACIYGSVPVLLVLEKSTHVRIEPAFAQKDLFLFYVDLAGKKDTVAILKDLHDHYLKEERLQEALGPRNEVIIRRAFQLLQRGQADELGRLMTEAQQIFDSMVAVHSIGELAAPLLHRVLDLEQIQPHIYGGKGVGSQGDGTAQFVARSAEDRDLAMEKITSAFPQMRCFPLTIRQAGNPERWSDRPARTGGRIVGVDRPADRTPRRPVST
jgi:galactokinase